MSVPIYGVEGVCLDKETDLLYVNPSLSETAPLHTHNFYEFFIVTNGSAYHLINDSVRIINKGDLIFIRPQDTHCYDFYYSEDFRIINIGFSKKIFQNIQMFINNNQKMNPLIEDPFPHSIQLYEPDLYDVSKEFNKIGLIMNSSDAKHATYHAQSYLSLLFVDYFFSYAKKDNHRKDLPQWLEEVLLEMQKVENLQEGFTKMISLASCSKNHLCRVLKSKCNLTPTQYINEQRLNYSVYLLTQTTYEILEISELCGFNNLSHFYHLFKLKFLCSPAKFRKLTGK